MLEYADAMVDGPAAARFRELDIMYPRSQFILTLREMESWLKSCADHWARVPLSCMHPRARFEYAWCRVKLFGRVEFDAENHRLRYERHVNQVRDFFRNRPNDLLEINIGAGDGWEKLCPFLNIPVPNTPFPWENQQSSAFTTG